MAINDISVKILLLTGVLALLPSSPFTAFTYLMYQVPFLSALNWFLPISEMIAIMEAWLVIVAVYYSILFVLNYVGILKS